MYATHGELRQPYCRLMAPPRGTTGNILIYLTFPETKVITVCILPLIISVYVYYFSVFTQLSLKVEPSESKTAGTKTEFDMK